VVLLPLAVACSSTAEPAYAPPVTTTHRANVAAGTGGSMARVSSSNPSSVPFTPPPPDLGAPCDPTRGVDRTGASLVVRHPTTIQRFPLQRVLMQISSTGNDTTSTTPLALLQKLFDTENTAGDGVFADAVHCDDAGNGAFGGLGQTPFYCPRAEGKLATSTGLLDESSPDFFAPVALVSRFDLIPSTFATCGEYRIVYAKRSGRTDPKNRVMLVFEGALTNPGSSLEGCRPVAEFLAGLESLGPDDLATELDKFYFQGLPGFQPVVHAQHYGLGRGGCSYAGSCGQVRVGQEMEAPFEFRQFQVTLAAGNAIRFSPTVLTSTPRPELFDVPRTIQDEITAEIGHLIDTDVTRLHDGRSQGFDVGESAVEGPAAPDFAAHLAASSASDAFKAKLTEALASQTLPACPPDDPLTADSVVARMTALTCPGCHSPEQVLPNGLHTGCGQTWPKTLAPVHIDENGNLSPALVDVFLPRRADFLTTYLRACDANAIVASLVPVVDGRLLQ
jgi:hypothetical protein